MHEAFAQTPNIANMLSPTTSPVSGLPEQTLQQASMLESTGISNQPIMVMLILASISLLPFVGMMVTSFVKIAVVLSMTRQALGTQQSPPTTVITGLALILTIYVMHPVGMQIYNRTQSIIHQKGQDVFDKDNVESLIKIVKVGGEPLKKFLSANAIDNNEELFYRLAYRMRQHEDRISLTRNDWIVLIPAFVVSELTKAFQIGFIIFLPFLVIDMAVSNILMALGMQMLSPTTISLPFKILLFVMVDGWYLISKGLVLGYQ